MREKALLAMMLACGLTTGSHSQAGTWTDKTWSQADRDIRTAMARYRVPGAAVMVVKDGHSVWAKGFGKRQEQGGLVVDTGTHFEIGSITKQFTAAAVLQLRDAGKLKLDDRLSLYLPDAPHASEVTLRNLLTHTSGLHDYFDGPEAEVDHLASLPTSYYDLIGRIAAMPLDFAPGSKWSYSNTGYVLLGRVVEVASRETYRAYLQRHFLTPLGMTETFTIADEGHVRDMAVGYRREGGTVVKAPILDESWGGAAGFLVSTLHDLSLWDAALRGGKVIAPASYREMATSFVTSANGSADYGFGLFVDSMYGQSRIGHTGGAQGFTSADEYFPAQDVRVIALTNSGDKTPEAGEMLTNVVYADLYPEIAAKALSPAAGESAETTKTVGDAFAELQAGAGYAHFSAKLKERLADGIGAKFKADLSPYGAATRAVFRRRREENGQQWYDYVMLFGPGVSIPFAVRMEAGLVAGMSIG